MSNIEVLGWRVVSIVSFTYLRHEICTRSPAVPSEAQLPNHDCLLGICVFGTGASLNSTREHFWVGMVTLLGHVNPTVLETIETALSRFPSFADISTPTILYITRKQTPGPHPSRCRAVDMRYVRVAQWQLRRGETPFIPFHNSAGVASLYPGLNRS